MPKRKSYTADFKLEVIKFAKALGNRAAAREFFCSEKNIRDWRMEEEELRKMDPGKRARGRPRLANLEENPAVYVDGAESFVNSAELIKVENNAQSSDSPSVDGAESFVNSAELAKVENDIQSPDLASGDHVDSFAASGPTSLVKLEENIQSSSIPSGEGNSNGSGKQSQMELFNCRFMAGQLPRMRGRPVKFVANSNLPANIQSVTTTRKNLSKPKSPTNFKDNKDKLFNRWLSSEIEKNDMKKNLIRYQILKTAAQKELIELQKQKLMLELQNNIC